MRKTENISNRQMIMKFLNIIKLFSLAFLMALVIKVSFVEAYKIPSESMEKTLVAGDYLLANKFIYGSRIPLTGIKLPSVREPRQDDVVVFQYPQDLSKYFVKRVVAVGGQIVEIKDKQVFVDGKKINEQKNIIHIDPIIMPGSAIQPRDNFGPVQVPEGYYFVMGDNRDNSHDSRYWGFVQRDLIFGKAFLIHWSWEIDQKTPEVSLSNPLSILEYLTYNTINLPQRIRWNRLMTAIN